MGNCTLSLSSTHVDTPGISVDWCVSLWVDVSAHSAPRLTSRLNSASDQHWLTLPQLQWSVSLGIAPPWDGSLVFCINKAQDASSKLVRIGIEVLFLLYCCYYSFEIKRIFGGKTVSCHCMCRWALPWFTEVTCIYVYNLLIVCGFIAKIDNEFIIIFIGKEFVNNFIVHLFPFWCMFRDLDLACFISLYACYYEISMYVLTRSHKYFGKCLDSVVGS